MDYVIKQNENQQIILPSKLSLIEIHLNMQMGTILVFIIIVEENLSIA